MITQILRRKGLGRGSCAGISRYWANELGRDVRAIQYDKEDPDCDILIRWGCTASVVSHHLFTINTSQMIHRVNDKVGCRRELLDLCPPTMFLVEDDVFCPPNYTGNEGMWIGRQSTHSQGRNAVFCKSLEDIHNDSKSTYWTLYLPKQKEYRIYCLFGKVLCVAEKIPTDPTAVLWNKAQNGSTFVNVRWGEWPIEVCKMALEAQRRIGIDFSGIDVIVYNEQPYLLELNSAPTLSLAYRQQCFAKGFEWVIQYIENYNKKPPFFEKEIVTNYKQLIHPAMKGE